MKRRFCPWHVENVQPDMVDEVPEEGSKPVRFTKTRWGTSLAHQTKDPQSDAPCLAAQNAARTKPGSILVLYAFCRRCGLQVDTVTSESREDNRKWIR